MAFATGVPTWTFNEKGAAWVQAVGSVAAIIAAGLFPLWHETQKTRTQRTENLSRLTALAFEVNGMAQAVADAYRSASSLAGISIFGNREECTPLVESISAFPMYALTDRHHLMAVVHLKSFAAEANRLWKAAVEHGDEMYGNWDAMERAKALRTEVSAFAEAVAEFV